MNRMAELIKDERHNTVAESRYWCNQYKMRAIELESFVILLLDAAKQAIPISEHPKSDHPSDWALQIRNLGGELSLAREIE